MVTEWILIVGSGLLLHSLPPGSYDSEGRLMNVTFPTGMVNNLYADINSALTVDIESSMTEEEISITTNTSTIRAFYTLAQGKAATTPVSSGGAILRKPLFVIVSEGSARPLLSKLQSCIITAQRGRRTTA